MANINQPAPIALENCKIFLKNLSGAPDRFNPQGGKRTFCVWIPSDIAPSLEDEGWPIKYAKPRDEEEEERPYLKVKCTYGKVPPQIYMCTNNNKILLNEETVGNIDFADIKQVDLVIRPYCYEEVAGKSGISAYVKNMYVTIVEDPFAHKYRFDDAD